MKTPSPADAALSEMRRTVSDLMQNALGASDNAYPRATSILHISDRCCATSGDDRMAKIITGNADDLLEQVRKIMPAIAWPLSITFVFERGHARVDDIGVFGIESDYLLRSRVLEDERISWEVPLRSYSGLGRLSQNMQVLASITPPSNMPVRVWSSGHDLMGSNHLNSESIYARSEIEFILKSEWLRQGITGIEEIIKSGAFPTRRNDDHIWFTATDVEGIDQHPMGQIKRKENAIEDFNDFLKTVRPELISEQEEPIEEMEAPDL